MAMTHSPWRSLAGLVLPLLVLNGLLTLGNRWPGLGVTLNGQLSIELALGVAVLAGWIGWRGAPSPRQRTGLAALASLWVVLRYVDITAPAMLGRGVNLYWDTQHVWQVLRMAGTEGHAGALALGFAALLLAVGVLFVLIRMLITALCRALGQTPARRVALLMSALVLAAWFAGPRFGVNTDAGFARPVSTTLTEQARMLAASIASRNSGGALLGPSPAFDGNLGVLAGADVLILFAEAYGAITFDAPHIASAIVESRRAFKQAIGDTGRHVVSARVRSPTFGGASWLAHAALLTGVDTSNPDHYAALLTTRRPSLVSHFARHGYRTIAWMPGIQRPWPEGRFYGFDRYATVNSIGYQGPAFGYWQVPDQASMALLEAQELFPAHPPGPHTPRLVVFPTVITHAPFRPVPPYVEDWSRILQPDGYTSAEVAAALAQPVDWGAPTPAYIDALRYQFEWVGAFLRRRQDADFVLIIIGDHQPIGAVTGPGAPWDVPVHVISRNPELTRRLEAAGFVPGIEPAHAALGGMHALTRVLAEGFSD